MIEKMIFMLFSPIEDIFLEIKRNFEHLGRGTLPRLCVQMI
jgi:hypothetical protein